MNKNYNSDNYVFRAIGLYDYGHDSSVWGKVDPPENGHVVEILDPSFVSKPCWEEICEAADLTDTTTIDVRDYLSTLLYSPVNEFFHQKNHPGQANIHQFFFLDIHTAKKMANKVQSSARNKRKNLVRKLRLAEAGGFHTSEVIERLYEIQEGCCYYSGQKLTKSPKNYVIDHIHPIYLGGNDWPQNLALVIKSINSWKSGTESDEDTLRWLAKEKGRSWLLKQKAYCKKVDRKRKKLDLEFRQQHENAL